MTETEALRLRLEALEKLTKAQTYTIEVIGKAVVELVKRIERLEAKNYWQEIFNEGVLKKIVKMVNIFKHFKMWVGR